MRNWRPFRKLRFVLALLGLSFLLVACGGGEGGGNDVSAGGSTPPSQDPSPAPTPDSDSDPVQQVSLTITREGAGEGRIVSVPAGIECGSSCSADFDEGQEITLTATAESGSKFDGWDGTCSATSSSSCTFVLTENAATTAAFGLEPFGANQAVLGPLSGATIQASRFRSSKIEGPITADSSLSNLSRAGTFDLELPGVDDDQWVIVKAKGGDDIDVDDDGVIDSAPTLNLGSISALARASEWRSGGLTVNLLTNIASEVVDREFSERTIGNFSQLEARLNVIAGLLLNSSLNDESEPTYLDLVGFVPSNADHRSLLRYSLEELFPITESILAGDSRAATRGRIDELLGGPLAESRRVVLAVEPSGDGSGTVTSTPAGIDCGTACEASYQYGKTVTLTASPSSGSVFVGWSEGCSPSELVCEVALDQARSIEAVFRAQPAIEDIDLVVPGAEDGNQISLISGATLSSQSLKVLTQPEGRDLNSPEFSLRGAPAWLTINERTGALSGHAPSVQTETAFAFEIELAAGSATATVAAEIAVFPVTVSEQGSVSGHAETLSLAGVEINLPAESVPTGTSITVERSTLGTGDELLQISIDAPSDSIGEFDLRLPPPQGAQAQASQSFDLKAVSESEEPGEGCEAEIPHRVAHQPRWFLGRFPKLRLRESDQDVFPVSQGLLEALSDAPLVAGERLVALLPFKYTTASALCSRIPEVDLKSAGADAIPVILVHGFVAGGGLGGATGTWGESFSILEDSVLSGARVLPFDFRWRTNASFREVAADLRKAVDRVRKLTGRDVHLVAHSFGGVLSRTYLQGLDVNRPAGHVPHVRSLTTVGTPHSGVFAGGDPDFPQGRDVSLIGLCAQYSCFESGIDISNALALELYGGNRGSVVRDLADGSHVFPEGLPVQALIGLRNNRATSRYSEGDGVITFEGQRFMPGYRSASSLLGSRDLRQNVSLAPVLGARVREFVLGDPSASADFPGRTSSSEGYAHIPLVKSGTTSHAADSEVRVDDPAHPFIQELLLWLNPPTLEGVIESGVSRVGLASIEACEVFGFCGVDLVLKEGRAASDVTVAIDWGDKTALGRVTLSECEKTGLCSSVGDKRYRIWKRIGAGSREIKVTYGLAGSGQSTAEIPVQIELESTLPLTATAAVRAVRLQSAGLNADQYDVCVAREAIESFSDCSAKTGGEIRLDIGQSPHAVDGLEPGVKYYFMLEARFGMQGLISDQVTATPISGDDQGSGSDQGAGTDQGSGGGEGAGGDEGAVDDGGSKNDDHSEVVSHMLTVNVLTTNGQQSQGTSENIFAGVSLPNGEICRNHCMLPVEAGSTVALAWMGSELDRLPSAVDPEPYKSRLVGFSGGCESSDSVCNVSMNRDRDIYVLVVHEDMRFSRLAPDLSVQREGSGEIRVDWYMDSRDTYRLMVTSDDTCRESYAETCALEVDVSGVWSPYLLQGLSDLTEYFIYVESAYSPPAMSGFEDVDYVAGPAVGTPVVEESSLVKLDNGGNPLPSDADKWSCVLDERTGLVWEVVLDLDHPVRSPLNTYTWYDPRDEVNSGDPGVRDGGECSSGHCDTLGYVETVNQARLCGIDDWRMPTVEELRSIVYCSTQMSNPPPADQDTCKDPYGDDLSRPTINQEFFPDTDATKYYWASDSEQGHELILPVNPNARAVSFLYGNIVSAKKSSAERIRLVSDR